MRINRYEVLRLALGLAGLSLAGTARAADFGILNAQIRVIAVPGDPVQTGNGVLYEYYSQPPAPFAGQWALNGSDASVQLATQSWYGDLSYNGGGTCSPTPGQGCGTVVDLRLGFFDTLTARSTTLAALTPVSLAVTFRYSGSATESESHSPTRSGSTINAVAQVRSSDAGVARSFHAGHLTETVMFTQQIGSPFEYEAAIQSYGSAESFIWPDGVYQHTLDGRLQISFRALTAGVFLTSASGFNVSAVPEPADWAFLIVGFGLTGTVVRRRRPKLPA